VVGLKIKLSASEAHILQMYWEGLRPKKMFIITQAEGGISVAETCGNIRSLLHCETATCDSGRI
jgi:hypothetical protein